MSVAFDLKGKVAIVTGHRTGIGKAVHDVFSELGARVFGFDIPDVDLSRLSEIEGHVARVAEKAGRIDVLVNNAGVTSLGSVLEITEEEVERVLRVNFKAPLFLMKAVVPRMIESGGGAIVSVSSDQAFIGKRFSAVYGASKAAIAQLTKSAALDFANRGIRINAVAPGSTDTPMLRRVVGELAARYPDIFAGTSEEGYRKAVPLGRFADPREIASTIAFLASEASSFVTGVVLPVDGGFTAQ